MRRFTMLLAALVFVSFTGLAGAEEKKLSKDDFDMVKRVDKLEAELAKLKNEVKDLKEKVKGCECSKEATASAKPVVAAPAPVGASARPEGDGWQYDTVKRQWWRFTQTTTFNSSTPATATQPATNTTVRYYQIGGRYYTQPQTCTNGSCNR